ncbi:MAG: hypothetical protein ABI467_05125 [Kofleriaceae bacterium]
MNSAIGTYWIVLVLAILVAFVVGFTRKGNAHMRMPARRRVLELAATPAEVFAAVMRLPRPFRVDASRDDSVVILSSPVSFGSWGFFYPVVIRAGARGGSHVTIGCTSKVVQFGPIVTRNHSRCVQVIAEQFEIPAARVVG